MEVFRDFLVIPHDTALASEGDSLYWVHPHLTSGTHRRYFPSRSGFFLPDTRRTRVGSVAPAIAGNTHAQ
jgi:hypothetical protein